MEDSRPHKKARLSFAKDMAVLVGPNKQRFMIYEDEMCARSGFFKAAYSARWATAEQDSSTKAVELPSDDPDIFNVYLHCVYKNEVDVGDLKQDLPYETRETNGLPFGNSFVREERRLLNAYILADKLQDIISANMVIDRLIQIYSDKNYMPGPETCGIIANNTTAESPLRRLAVDYASYESSYSDLEDLCQCESVPKAFICDVLLRRIREPKQDEWWEATYASAYVFVPEENRCHYHQHDVLHPLCGEDCENGNTAEESDVEGDSVRSD